MNWSRGVAITVLAAFGGACTTDTAPPAPVQADRAAKPTQQAKLSPLKPQYRVKRGDTLYAIAWRFGLDYRRFAAANRIQPPYRIYPGQRLALKESAVSRGPAKRARKPSAAKPSIPPATRASTPKKSAIPTAAPKPKKAATALRWRWPLHGVVKQKYAPAKTAHKGIRIGGRQGQSVHAAEAGTVVYSGSGLVGYGELIIIKHNATYLSAYGQAEKRLVKEGDAVKRGSVIARLGPSARRQSILHFEIRRNGKPIDPLRLLPKR